MNEELEKLKGNSLREMIRAQESGLRRILRSDNSTMPPKLENKEAEKYGKDSIQI